MIVDKYVMYITERQTPNPQFVSTKIGLRTVAAEADFRSTLEDLVDELVEPYDGWIIEIEKTQSSDSVPYERRNFMVPIYFNPQEEE